MRAVFDTNILISALLWRGPPYECLLAAEGGLVELFVSEAILSEFIEKLVLKFGVTSDVADQAVQNVRRFAQCVSLLGQVGWVTDDPDDDKIIETAVVADAAFIVSGDRHLLDLAALEGIKIVSPRDFLDHLRVGGPISQE